MRALPNFDGMIHLQSLRAQHNEITAFDPSMTTLVQLRELDLSQACRTRIAAFCF
jgi:Leucine-rich repeat (LRR) protein